LPRLDHAGTSLGYPLVFRARETNLDTTVALLAGPYPGGRFALQMPSGPALGLRREKGQHTFFLSFLHVVDPSDGKPSSERGSQQEEERTRDGGELNMTAFSPRVGLMRKTMSAQRPKDGIRSSMERKRPCPRTKDDEKRHIG
jgi:hypothetical protein